MQLIILVIDSYFWHQTPHIDGSVQDCSISSALAMERLQSGNSNAHLSP